MSVDENKALAQRLYDDLFTKPGRYTYWCLIHPGMDGHITVLAAGQ